MKKRHLTGQKKSENLCQLSTYFFLFLQQNSTWKMPRTGAHKKCLMKLWDLKDFEQDAERVAFFDKN